MEIPARASLYDVAHHLPIPGRQYWYLRLKLWRLSALQQMDRLQMARIAEGYLVFSWIEMRVEDTPFHDMHTIMQNGS